MWSDATAWDFERGVPRSADEPPADEHAHLVGHNAGADVGRSTEGVAVRQRDKLKWSAFVTTLALAAGFCVCWRRTFSGEGAGSAGVLGGDQKWLLSRLHNVYERVDHVGAFGGTCTCPDEQVYQVGDRNDGCKTVACYGGVSSGCEATVNAWRLGMQVKCAPARNLESSTWEEEAEKKQQQEEEVRDDGHSFLSWTRAQAKAAETMKQMTDEECMGMLYGHGIGVDGGWVGEMHGVPRMGIPDLKMQDSSAGFRPYAGPSEYGTTTSWPSLLALAASWDEGLVSVVAQAIAQEFKGKGANVILGPGLNVHRSPLGGRNFEYISGEDPYLGARLGASYVKAAQGERVMVTIKHWAFNEQELDRSSASSNVDVRTAFELYYPPFEAAIKAGAAAVMCSYNFVNGTQACSNSALVTGVLRDKLRFPGFVMSDWDALKGTDALNAGTDMEQPDPGWFAPALLKQSGAIFRARVAAQHILAAIYHMRLDEFPGCKLPCNASRQSNQRTAAHVDLVEEAAAKGIVLLQNNGVLPLRADVKTILVLGRDSDVGDTQNTWGPGSPYSGGGSGHVPALDVVTPLEGIRRLAKSRGIEVLTARSDLDRADIVIVVGATTSREQQDRASLGLDHGADRLIAKVAKEKPTVVLLEIPGAVLTPWRSDAAAIACMFLGGERTGSAWASFLFGDTVPSGKLPITLPASEANLPMPGAAAAGPVVYSEGLATGYRSPTWEVAFPFGHGLSYTQFELSNPSWTESDAGPCATFPCFHLDVKNVGKNRGAEVVQAYLHFGDDLAEPKLLLRGFQKTSELQPGSSETLTFALMPRDFSTYNVGKGSWETHDNVTVRVGTSSADLLAPRLELRDSPAVARRKSRESEARYDEHGGGVQEEVMESARESATD
mmetsp:Transcript_58947/g.169267  ORF Transcript_58947/g.169267 Transcript_58947/m.169267 type:complete len:893 (+) Transcript_58947:76-2754(+)